MSRWLTLAALVGTLGISGYYRARARATGAVILRRQEPLGLRLGRLAVALPLFGSLLASLVWPGGMAWATVPLPTWTRWLGVGLSVLAVPAAWWVFRSLGRNISETVLTRSDQVLVTTGPYRWVRHPLYSTGIMLFLGVGLSTANAFVLALVGLVIVLVLLVIIPREEAALVARFGDAYVRYRGRSGRLLPRVV